MITLALDASTYRGSVAVLDDARVLVQSTAAMRGRDREQLMPAVATALREAGASFQVVERVICGAGPGSFTSLRIAASIAKGIALGRAIPLFTVSSLALIVAGNVSDGPRGPRRYLAALDALRGETFVAEFEHHEGVVREIAASRLIANDEVEAAAAASKARAVGPDLPHGWLPHARGTALMLDDVLAAGPVDLASWEPVYGRLAEAQAKWEAAHGRTLPR
ncbi:MAG: tRNA (adenosine(37)-N6)-threonylcarbamoyltransferase complex dimerization subunit type 1 TsaB [Gemmatimonadaceae bacterium]